MSGVAGNSPGPTYKRIFYRVNGVTHVHQVSVNAVGNILLNGGWEVESRGQLTVFSPSVYLNRYIDEIARFFSDTQAVFDYAEFLHQPNPANPPSLIGIFPINRTGTLNATSQGTTRITFACRTVGGGIFRPTLIGVIAPTDSIFSPLTGGTDAVSLFATYLQGNDVCAVGRDGQYPMVMRRAITKTDDPTRRELLNL